MSLVFHKASQKSKLSWRKTIFFALIPQKKSVSLHLTTNMFSF